MPSRILSTLRSFGRGLVDLVTGRRRRPPQDPRVVNIAVVNVVPLTDGDFLARWPQPFLSGDADTDWYVTTSIGTKKVQRDRLTDEVYFCSVMVAEGTTSFTVVTGSDTSPATGWTTPTLTGLALTFTGHDGCTHVADLTDTTVTATLRDGHNERAVRRWTHSLITDEGAGNQTAGTEVAGVHTYLHYRADVPDVVEMELLISNASTKIKTNGTGTLERTHAAGGLFGTFGFVDCTLTAPSGWVALAERPLADEDSLPATVNDYVSNAHAFPSKMATVRRYVLYKTATVGAAQAAQDLLELKGLGRATALGPRSWHNVRAFGPAKSLLPDLDRGFTGGFATAETTAATDHDRIADRVAAGIAISDGSSTASRMGLFHPAGEPDPQGTGGTDIQTCAAFLQTRSWVRYCRLYGDLLVDSNGVFLFNRTTGRPLTTSDFGNAYTTPSAQTDFWIDKSPQWIGRQPFVFYCQNNGGYEYQSSHQTYFAGWIAPEWPSHFIADTSHFESLPADQTWFKPQTQRAIPTAAGMTSHVATSPRTLLDFQCRYRPLLEIVPRFRQLNPANGFPWFYPMSAHLADAPLGSSPQTRAWKEPADSQHACRMYQKMTVAAYLGGDLLAIDIIDQFAEWFALEYSEVGHVPKRYAGIWPDDESTPPGQPLNSSITPNIFSLLKRLEIQSQSPGTARYGNGRAEGWVGTLFATQYALASVSRRETGYTASRPYGIKRRCEMFYDFIRIGLLPNGASYKESSSTAGGQLANAFNGDSTFGPIPGPLPTTVSMMQIGLELPIVHWALFSLGKQLGRQEHEPRILDAYRNYTALTGIYTNYSSDATVYGPPKYFGVWENTPGVPIPGQFAPWYGSGSGTPGYPNHASLIELAYRIQGSRSILGTANHLGHRAVGYPNQTPATRGAQLLADASYRGEWNAGLIQLLLDSPGPDTAPAPPASTFPTLVGSCSPNPVAAGQTVTFFGHVVPGTNPASSALQVTIDLSQTGEVSPVKDMLDDGVAPDVTAADLTFTYEFDTTGVPTGRYLFPMTVVDAEDRQSSAEMPLVIVESATDPIIVSASAFPQPVAIGAELILRATVLPGSAPPSTNLSVTANLTPFGGAADADMLDDGNAPDTTAADDEYAVAITVGSETRPGTIGITITATDAEGRHSTVDVSVTVFETPIEAKHPQIVGTVAGAPATPGSTITLLGLVTPGADPASTGLTASVDLSAIGGTLTPLLDDGVAPDVTADDLTFTAEHDVPADTAPGIYTLPFEVMDAEERTGSGSLVLEVVPAFVSTDPVVSPAGSPNPIQIGQTLTITADVTLGSSPESTGVMVTADLSAIGGSALKVLADSGVAPDVTEDDLRFTGTHFIGQGITPGNYQISVRMSDAQGREDIKAFGLLINPLPPPTPLEIPDHAVTTMHDMLTNGTVLIDEGGSAKVLRYVRNGLNAALLSANVEAMQFDVFDEGGSQPEVAIWSTGRILSSAQNQDGTLICKSAVVIDGQSPSPAGHTIELLLDAATIGLRGGRAYRLECRFFLIEPPTSFTVPVKVLCEEAFGS